MQQTASANLELLICTYGCSSLPQQTWRFDKHAVADNNCKCSTLGASSGCLESSQHSASAVEHSTCGRQDTWAGKRKTSRPAPKRCHRATTAAGAAGCMQNHQRKEVHHCPRRSVCSASHFGMARRMKERMPTATRGRSTPWLSAMITSSCCSCSCAASSRHVLSVVHECKCALQDATPGVSMLQLQHNHRHTAYV